MQWFVHRLRVAALAGAAVLTLTQPAPAQFGAGGGYGAGGQYGNPPRFSSGMVGAAGFRGFQGGYGGLQPARGLIGGNPYTASLTSVPAYDPYSPYANPYLPIGDPFGGYFRGVADLTLAYGQYQIDYQKARLLNQEVVRSIMDSRRRFWEEMRLERAMQPTADDIINQTLKLELARARKEPQDTDVTSGKSLNILLAHAKAMHARGKRGPSIPLDPALLKRVNVTTGRGNIGLIRGGGKLQWPIVVRGGPFDKLTQQLEFAIDDAINRARINGRVDAGILKDMERDLLAMHTALDDNIGKMLLSEHTSAKRFLNLLDDGVVALTDPNVVNYFNNKFEAQGRTVAELVEYMSREGLIFAPSAPGDEAAYRSLQTSLAAYDDVLAQASP